METQYTDSKRLAEARNSLNLTQEEVAKGSDLPRAAISKIENGTQEIPAELLRFYKRDYGISSDWLLFGEGTNPFTGGNTSINSGIKGNRNQQVHGSGNQIGGNNRELEECRREAEKWRSKYIALLEKIADNKEE